MSVDLEDGLSTTIANSTVARTAFVKGADLPPEDKVIS